MPAADSQLQAIRQIGSRTREFCVYPQACSPLNDYRIGQTGISIASPQFRFVNIPVVYSQILVTFRGVGRVLIDGQWRECRAGQAYCTPKGNIAGYSCVSNWEIGWITYEDVAPVWSLKDARLLDLNPMPFEHIIYGLHQEASSHKDPALLYHWTELLQSNVSRVIKFQNQPRLRPLWLRVRASLSFAWTLPGLAEAAGFSAEYLRILCLKETGKTPMHYVTQLRMQHAISLLNKGYKVDAIAEEVGYANPFAFSVAFKKFTGKAPSHFIRERRPPGGFENVHGT